MTSYFVKQPEKYRREPRSRHNDRTEVKTKLPPIWTFSTEAEAIEFAKTFKACWVEVWFEGKVLFRNFPTDKPRWMSKKKAARISEQNAKVRDEQTKESEETRYGKRYNV